MAKLNVPVTNIGFEMYFGEYGEKPSTLLGDIKSADGIEYQVNTIKYAPVNKGGYSLSVPTLKEGQPATIEIYMNDTYTTLHNKFHDNDVSTPEFYCSIAFKYPKNDVNKSTKDYFYNGFISKLHQSGGSEAEAQYYSFEFTPVGAPAEFIEETNTDNTDNQDGE